MIGTIRLKKCFALLLCVSLCLCGLTACTPRGTLTVNGTQIGKGIVRYFTDVVRQEQPEADEAALTAAVHQKVAAYVAVNSAFAERGLSLTTLNRFLGGEVGGDGFQAIRVCHDLPDCI